MNRPANWISLISALLFAWASLGWAESPVWKVEKDGSAIYLGGTIHMLKPSDYPLPDAFEQAYSVSERLFFEADIGRMNSPEGQAMLMGLAMSEPGKTLSNTLTPSTYQKFSQALAQRGINIMMVESFKVSMAVVTLQVAEFMRIGLSLEGVDKFYYQKAERDRVPMGFLESIEEQFSFMASIGQGWEDKFVELSLRDMEKSSSLYDEMNRAWKSGDVERLNQLFLVEMKRDYPEAYNSLLLVRNFNWLPQIEKMFQQPGTEFVLVGVAHMVGEDGLLQQLRKQGYEISQL